MNTGPITKNSIPPTMKIGIAAIFAAIGMFGSFRSIIIPDVPTSAVAVTISSFFGLLVIFLSDRLQGFDFSKLKLEMQKIEEAREEVEDKREEVARIALATAEITAFMAAFHRRLGSERSHDLEASWLESRVASLLKDAEIPYTEQNRVFRWLNEVRAMDAIEDRNESNAVWERVWDEVESEIKMANKPAHSNPMPASS